MLIKLFVLLIACFILVGCAYSYPIFETENFVFSVESYLMLDLINFKNVVGLDSNNKDDKTTYLGIDYSLGFKSEYRNNGPIFYLKLERNGPYDYDAPLFINHKLTVPGPRQIKPYSNTELLPQVEEFWLDLPILSIPLRLKAGLFPYEIGKGFAQGTGTFENYGVSLCYSADNFNWRFHYFRPDLVYKTKLGPTIRQERQEGILYQTNAANYFTFDMTFLTQGHKLQPFASLLLDSTSEGKRDNTFVTPTDKELLGIFGLDYDFSFRDFSLGLEIARNFGVAYSNNDDFKDVEHKGYLLYATAAYNIGKFSPHCQFLLSSGNKVTTEMVDNGDEKFPGGANKAFSIYSPLNMNFWDSLTPSLDSAPLVFLGWGYGLNYGVGINRPSTLADDSVLENLIMPSFGFDYKFTDKFTLTLDYWYIKANERGVGSLEGVAKELSRNLGQEIDLTLSFEVNEHFNISLYSGYFLPGKYFREERDDTEGSLFTPFVRGDGNANAAYQIELVTEFKF